MGGGGGSGGLRSVRGGKPRSGGRIPPTSQRRPPMNAFTRECDTPTRVHVRIRAGADAPARARASLHPLGERIGAGCLETLELVVSEPGDGFPRPSGPPSPSAEGGWGLFLVAEVVDRWWIEPRDDGTRVVAE